MSHACAVRISAHHPVPIVKSKQDCRSGARKDRSGSAAPHWRPGSSREGFLRRRYKYPYHQLFVIIDLVSKGRESSRDAKRRYGSATADERLEDPAAVIKPAGKVAGIVYRKQIGLDRAGNIVFREGAARQEKRVNACHR